MAPSRPLLRYHGGKWKLAQWIVDNLPPHRIYVEPYGGAASILLRKPRSYAEVYNDLDSDVVNLFQVVRSQPEDLARALALTPFAESEFKLAYEETSDPLEKARRLCVRSWMGHGGNAATAAHAGFRRNTTRRGTTPAMDWHRFPTVLPSIVERLRGVVIECRQALDVMATHDTPDTLHYVDPPYLPTTRDQGRDYRHEMTQEDHIRLADALHGLQGKVVLSGYTSPLYDDLFSGWRRLERIAHADSAGERQECLWLSPNCPARGLFDSWTFGESTCA